MKQVGKEKRKRKTKPEDTMKQIQRILQERGSKALEIAKKEILQERVECKEAREALTYFMTEYWHDVARPALLSLVCEAVGGKPEITTPIAVPMILIGGAIDIHDDIIDQSEVKDGRPTVLGKFGRDVALLVGDALLFKGLTLLNEASRKGISARKMRAILELISEMFFELGDAEALELQFRGRLDVAPDDYLGVIKKKGADVEVYARISAVLGDASKGDVESLARYGRLLGMLAVLKDDVSDMTDTKELIHRIKHECLPLPMLYALRNPKAKSSISSIFPKKRITEKDAKPILETTRKAGGIAQTDNLVHKLVEEGCSNLNSLRFNRRELTLLIRSML